MCLIGQVDSKETGQGQGEEQGDSWMWFGGAGEGGHSSKIMLSHSGRYI